MSQSQDLLDNVLPYIQVASQRAKKLPFFTLGITAAMILFFFLSFVSSIYTGFSLRPSDIPKFELSRLTTYPLVHSSFLHILFNLAAFVPLCSRFERRFGTLRSVAMFLGPFESVPGLLYCAIDAALLRDTAIAGCSVFVFVMLAIEATQYQGKLVFGGRQIPAYAAPIVPLIVATILLPGSSFIVHCTAIAAGLVFGSGRVDFLLLPLKVVNFVESRAANLFERIPMWVTAESSTSAMRSLPTVESPSSSTSTLTRVSSNSISQSKPPTIRQVSSKWPAGQREE